MSEPDRIGGHVQVTDHVTGGLALLTQEFRGKPVIAAFLRAWLKQVQVIEDAAWEMLVATTLATAKHDQLDQIGAILGFGRGSITDDEVYRAALRGVVLANRSSGTGDELLAILNVLGNGTTSTLTEHAPAAIGVARVMPWPLMSAAIVATILRRAKSAGVRLVVEDIPEGDLFTLATGERIEVDAARGFSDTDGLVGGQMIGVV